jgi:primosomal protein N' (replication factor Y)
MDLDTTRSKNSFERILNDFSAHRFDVLVGTQMVTKGLDFGNVSLVGVIDLDMLLHFPDFRSYERAFQMAVQVSGRAGRRDHRGKVIIQTRDIKHPVVQHIRDGNYDSFYQQELLERSAHEYPPYTRMIRILFKHKDADVVREAAMQFSAAIPEQYSHNLLGPHEPLINRIRNEYLQELWFKLNRNTSNLSSFKFYLVKLKATLQQKKIFRSLKIVFNVDPY